MSSGISRSLESVVNGHRPRSQTVGVVRVDQQGRLVPPLAAAHSVVMLQDPRRFSEASIVPPPRPPPPNLKRFNQKSSQRRTPALHVPTWPPPAVPAPAVQTQPQQQQQPQQGAAGSNLTKMAHITRSTPQLDDPIDSRERERERERGRDHVQSNKDNLISQVRDGVIPVCL